MPLFRAPKDPQTLELRIHGIMNSPPWEMLGVTASDVRLTEGDDEGGFFVSTLPADDPSTPPPGVRREAYSWGRMARSDGGAIGPISQLFVQLAWLLILPFGLCNSAYWTRRIPQQHAAGGWRAGRGAGSLRVFALGLTLLYVCALASVSLDLVGSQCLTIAHACPALPDQITQLFGAVAGSDRSLRLAIMSGVPIVGVLVLYLVSHHARVRYEAAIFATAAGLKDPAAVGTRRPLAAPGFWSLARVGAPTERLHIAAAVLLVGLLLSWDNLFASTPACSRLEGFFTNSCLAFTDGPIARAPFVALGLVACAVGLAVVVVFVVRGVETAANAVDGRTEGLVLAAQRRQLLFAGWSLTFAWLVYLATILAVVLGPRYDSTETHYFVGLVAAPSILVGVLLAICVSALGWRRGVPRGLSIALIAVGAFLVLVAEVMPTASAWRPVLLGAAAVLVLVLLVCIVAWPGKRRSEYRYQGWSGMGPGVLMLLSLGAAMILSTLLVLGTLTWLQTGSSQASGAGVVALAPPRAFGNFSVTLPVLVLLLLAFVGAMVLFRVIRLQRLSTPPTPTPPGEDRARHIIEEQPTYPTGRPPAIRDVEKLPSRVLKSRRFAAIMHRGEPVLGFVALLVAIGLVWCIAVPPQVWGAGQLASLWNGYRAIIISVLGAIAVAAVTAVAVNALTKAERPLGVMWDLICFLPRAGHPFGPPCYSDRVIPELRDRVVDWLEPEAQTGSTGVGRGVDPGKRRVILSAHSLGAVLAVSCVFTLSADPRPLLNRVGLLTYGTQLRVYFGRFWPELFGPEALGTVPSRGPSVRLADPWQRQVDDDHRVDRTAILIAAGLSAAGPDEAPRDPTLCSLLTRPSGEIAWFNLWRRTDFLGFPVNSYGDNPIDSGADEFAPKRYLIQIATHPGYPDSPQYLQNLERMMKLG